MATSYRKRGNIWQARITWRANGRQKEKVVSLDTSRDSVADIRMIDINRNEKAIRRLKEGEKISLVQKKIRSGGVGSNAPIYEYIAERIKDAK